VARKPIAAANRREVLIRQMLAEARGLQLSVQQFGSAVEAMAAKVRRASKRAAPAARRARSNAA
jgi:hypothetical protein